MNMNNSNSTQEKYDLNTETGQISSVNENDGDIIFEENGTFCRAGSMTGGFIEIDLQISKQRGQEERFLVISASGLGENNEASKADVILLDEQLFNKLKNFIAKLNWND